MQLLKSLFWRCWRYCGINGDKLCKESDRANNKSGRWYKYCIYVADLEKGMQDMLLMQDRWERAWSASYTTLFTQDITSHLLLIHVFHDVIQHQLLLENERLTWINHSRRSKVTGELPAVIIDVRCNWSRRISN